MVRVVTYRHYQRGGAGLLEEHEQLRSRVSIQRRTTRSGDHRRRLASSTLVGRNLRIAIAMDQRGKDFVKA